MRVIDLAKNNPYQNYRIFSTRPVWGPNGKRYELINYMYWGGHEDNMRADPLLVRVVTFVLLLFPGVFILPFLSNAYWNTLSQAYHGEFFIKNPETKRHLLRSPVYSEISFKDHLWKRFLSSPSAHALYRKTLRVRKRFFEKGFRVCSNPVQFNLCPWGKVLAMDGKSPWTATVSLGLGDIQIALSRTEDAILTSLLFEMGNLSQLPREVKRIKKKVAGKIKTADADAKSIERIEYTTSKIYKRIISKSVPWWGKGPTRFLLKNLENSFEEWWKKNKHLPHTEHYRIRFRKKNPHLSAAS